VLEYYAEVVYIILNNSKEKSMLEVYSEISSDDISRLSEGPRETDPFDGGVTLPLAGEDLASKAAFYSLEDNDIRALQKTVDRKALNYIDQAEKQGVITPEGAAYLRSYYEDSMQSYNRFYDTLIGVLKRPGMCRRNDLEPGEVDDKNYSETYITPNNSMLLVYPPITDDPDLSDNNVFVTLPGMKNISRAVAKIAAGGKYDVAYQKEIEELRLQYGENNPVFRKKCAALTPPYMRLQDVLRCTISVPTYDSIEKVISLFATRNEFEICAAKDKFQENLSAHDTRFWDNKKNYRDKKICLKKDNMYFEIQFKVQLLEKADKLSHAHYEKLREKIDEYNRADKNDLDLCRRLEHEKTWMEWGIQNINRKGIDEYNLFILDVALKKDTRLKKEKIRQLRQRFAECKDEAERQKLQKEIYMAGQSLNAAPVTPEAQTFIQNNFIVRPYKAIDRQHEFSAARPELQSFAMLNYFLVSPRYRATISGRMPDDYNEKYNQAVRERERIEAVQLEKECRLYRQEQKKQREKKKKVMPNRRTRHYS